MAVTPTRLRPKGPLGPDFFRQPPAAAGRPKQSAVERLEADKVKYVKSQAALCRQQPVRALSPAPVWPTTPTNTRQEGAQFDLEHLTNLISVTDGARSRTTVSSEARGAPGGAPNSGAQKKERPQPPPRPDRSSPAKVRLKASRPLSVESAGSPGSPAAGAVRRVDVMPQAGPLRTSCRPPHLLPLQPPQVPLRSAASQLRLFRPRTAAVPSPLRPDSTPGPPAAPPDPAPPLFPPPSPAITRLSSCSSRKRPSLTRSKSDMSERFSRAGTELERFFNLCGLDPADLQVARSTSDVVSLARFHSVSAPGSECAASGREGEDDDEAGGGAGGAGGADRVPYGVSVIERNARVIKWLYGLRQDKDSAARITSL